MSGRGQGRGAVGGAKKKINPFWTYFLKREKELELEAGGKQDRDGLMTKIGGEWEMMNKEQRASYSNNNNYNKESKNGNSDDDGGVLFNSFGMTLDAIHLAHREKEVAKRDKMAYAAQIIDHYKEKKELAEMPIILCQFSTYSRKIVNGVMHVLPSEIAMSVFNMRKGLMFSHFTIIDPGPNYMDDFPGDEVELNSKKQEIFLNAQEKQLTDYKAILKNIDWFLTATVTSKVVLCVNQDEIDVTKSGFQWLCDHAGVDSSEYEVLSLPFFITKYAVEVRKIAQTMDPKKIEKVEKERKSAMEMKEKIVGGMVAYPPEFPLIESLGIFTDMIQVEALLMRSNYCYYPELACTYHMELVDGSEFCPMIAVNRYAFVLMDVLLRHFPDVIPDAGRHYPRINDLKTEGSNRQKMLSRFTKHNPFNFVQFANRHRSFRDTADDRKREWAKFHERMRLMGVKEKDLKIENRKFF